MFFDPSTLGFKQQLLIDFGRFGFSFQLFTIVVLKRTDWRQVQCFYYCCCLMLDDCGGGCGLAGGCCTVVVVGGEVAGGCMSAC